MTVLFAFSYTLKRIGEIIMTIGTIAEVVKAVKAIDYQSAHRFEEVTSVAFDARRIQPGGLFVPLVGQTDGHDYINQAIENGAVATLWGRKDQDPAGVCTIWVDDPLTAMQDLAKWYLEKVNPLVVGVTGSSGKTTTKDMTAAVLGAKYRVYKTQGNYNNDIGLPQTILDMPDDTQAVVLEMGMSEFGEIEFLSKLAQPEIAVITMIGESHMENLGSRQGIAKAKMEILAGMNGEGTLIYPINEPLLHDELAGGIDGIRTVTFGTDGEADLTCVDVETFADHSTFNLAQFPEVACQIPVLGTYNIQNALAALQIGLAAGVDLALAVEALANFSLTANRSQWVAGVKGCRILNDSYNASPAAMKAVLTSFKDVPCGAGRRMAVLGDMLELGTDSKAMHAGVSVALSSEDFSDVYLYGEEMSALKEALSDKFAPEQIHYYLDDMAQLISDLEEKVAAEDILVVKSSNGTGLLKVVAELGIK